MQTKLMIIGSAFGFIAVVNGAFGSHALREIIPDDRLDVWETASRYMMYHAIAILLSAVMMDKFHVNQVQLAGWSFVIGVILFCGSLAIVALTGITWFGALAPFGGSAFLFGWAFLAAGAWKASKVISAQR